MCGNDVAEKSAYSWRDDCHTHDGDDILGGFHDAGDHVMFGLAQGYTASIINWGLYEFSDSYKNLGQTEHIKILSDHFSDFISRCVAIDENKNITKILVQKGNPVVDHKYWGTPEAQERVEGADRNKSVTYTPLAANGDNKKPDVTHSQIYWSDDLPDGGGCADIAFEYAATLASAYVNAKAGYFGESAKTDTKYDGYLAVAKKLYDFGAANNAMSISQGENGCYNSGSFEDDKKWAATWLYLATEDSAYNISSGLTKSYKDNYNISWDSVDNAAALLYAGHVSKDTSAIVNTLNSYVTSHQYYVFGGESGGWGNMRHNAAYQAAVLVAAKYADGEAKDNLKDWAQMQMNVILGDNQAVNANGDKGVCFITGFAKNSIQNPHYRATSSDASSVVMRIKDDKSVIDDDSRVEHVLIGGLAGGWFTDNQSSFEDRRSDYQQTEVACDYNACLTVAAAGLYNFFKTGHTYEIPEGAGVKTQYLQPETASNAIQLAQTQSFGEIDSPALKMAKGVSIRAAQKFESVDASGYDQSSDVTIPIPEKLYGLAITSIEVEFDKNSGNGTVQLEPWGNGTNQFDYNLQTSGTVFSFNPDRIANNTGTPDTLSKIIVKKYWNDGQKVKTVKFYYDAGSTFTVTPESEFVLKGEKIKLTVTGAEGSIGWDTGGNGTVTKEGSDWYYTAGETGGTVTIIGTDDEGKEGKCIVDVQDFRFIGTMTASIPEGGSAVFTLNGSVDKWDYDSDDLKITDNKDNSYTVEVAEGASGLYTITAHHGSAQAQTTFDVAAGVLQITNSPIKLRTEGSKKIELNFSSGEVTYSITDPSIAEISADGTITATSEGTTQFTATRNGVTATGTIQVVGELTINGITEMNQGKTIKLTATNNIGAVSWESSDENVAAVDQNGNVTSSIEGTVTITATDEDGAKATHVIEVKEIAETVDVNGMEPVGDKIMLTKDDKDNGEPWSKLIPDLQIRDENGNRYYYYIVEVDENGIPVTQIKGAGAVYIPLNYTGNGQSLNDNGSPVNFSVTNKKTGETQGELPSAGGVGTKGFYGAGMVIMCSAAAGYYLIRRRRRRVRK